MRIFNKDKTIELQEYDLSQGYLEQSQLLLKHYEAVEAVEGEFHYETIAEYENGGKEVQKVWDVEPVEAREAYDEYEDILVYIPYEKKELAAMEIDTLKGKLAATDYQSIRDMASILLVNVGASSESLASVIKRFTANEKQRQEWRNRINELELEVDN